MISFLEEEVSVWDRLASANLPIVLYGMGDGAEKILRELSLRNLSAAAIFASDEFVRGHSWRGYPICRFSEICTMYDRFIILLAFGVHDAPMMEKLYCMSEQYELYAPDVPVAGEGAFDVAFLRAHESAFMRVYERLADDQSRRVLEYSLRYKISGRIEYLKAMESTPEEVYKTLLCPSHFETYVDLGAYDGDTIREFLHYTGGQYQKIIALEPDRRNYKKLVARTPQAICLQAGAWCEDCTMRFAAKGGRNSSLGSDGVETVMRTVDSVLGSSAASYLKFDVEGAEYEALCGAEKTMRTYRPKLFVAAYHRNEDLFRLPLLIHELNPAYQLYLRHYPYIPAWETNIVAI